MAYTKSTAYPYSDTPSKITPVIASAINKWEDTLFELSGAVGLPARRYLTSTSADQTTAFQNWIAAAKASGEVMVGDKSLGTIRISGTLDMRANGLRYVGNGMQITCTSNTVKAAMVGGYSQVVTGLYINRSTAATSANTAAIGVELYAMFQGVYMDWQIDAHYTSLSIGQADWDGTGQNTVFSCLFQNIFALGWANRCLDMRTFPAGGASSTGNVFSNFYLHNNPSGVATTVSTPLWFQDWDESHFEQMNLEWCDLNGNDAWFFQRCRNFALTSIHFEGLNISGNVGMFRPFENCVITVRNVTLTNSTIVNSTGAKSLLRLSQPTAAPIYFNFQGVRVRSLTNASSNAVTLVDLASDANADISRVTIDNFSTVDAAIVGELVLGDNANSPVVQQINDGMFGGRANDPHQLYRAVGSMARDSFTTNNAGTRTSGLVRFTFFTAEETRSFTSFRAFGGSTAAAATPSLCRVGLYTLNAAGAMTLVARSASNTTMFSTASTANDNVMNTTGGYPASYTVVAGMRYAMAEICVTAATAPSAPGQALSITSLALTVPALCGQLTGQTDLPTSTTLGALAASGTRVYMELR